MPAPARLLPRIDSLIETVEAHAREEMAAWAGWNIRPEFQPSAENLAHWLALRHQDLRELQRELMVLGLSSLGRLESRVMPSLLAVRSGLAAMAGGSLPLPALDPPTQEADFFAGEARLEERSRQMFGQRGPHRRAALMVTCPAEAAETGEFMRHLARHGVEAVRINCAHDGADRWLRMVENARLAGRETGRPMRVFMDLAGPKIRTGEVVSNHDHKRLFTGDRVAVLAPGLLDAAIPPAVPADVAFTLECTLADPLEVAQPGQRMLIDDGKIHCVIDQVREGMLIASVRRCKEEGAKLKPEKGINFPDTDLAIPALTAKDRADLAFVAAHADGVSFSFVQSAEDVALLQDELARLRPDDWQDMALILKIETAQAVRNLPEIVVRAAARQPVAVMIARGDLAIEIGFVRLAEMQEEILWLTEAAQVPVIWATQVLEHLVKEGLPNRGELTDAAMAARAECVMLNKGLYLFEAIDELDHLLGRMGEHVQKKTPRLRPLMSW